VSKQINHKTKFSYRINITVYKGLRVLSNTHRKQQHVCVQLQ